MRIKRGPVYIASEFFSDARHGGCRHAELAARARRDEALIIAGPHQQTRKRNTPQFRKRVTNRSGIAGVYFDGIAFRATWYEDGHKYERNFSTNKYGFNEAKRLAAACRLYNAERVNMKGDDRNPRRPG